MSHRPRRLRARKPPLTHDLILAWADDHREKTGEWPDVHCGEVLAAPTEKWANIDQCLRIGFRSLPGGDTLSKLLVRERGHRSPTSPPSLSEEVIAAWAIAHRERTGDWPTQQSGPVEGQPGEVWAHIDSSLRIGQRSLPGCDSLAKFLHRRFGARNWGEHPPLTEEEIVAWADEHKERTGRWPAITSGPVALSPDDTWGAIDDALRRGSRGLPGGSSIVKLLVKHRGVRNEKDLPPVDRGGSADLGGRSSHPDRKLADSLLWPGARGSWRGLEWDRHRPATWEKGVAWRREPLCTSRQVRAEATACPVGRLAEQWANSPPAIGPELSLVAHLSVGPDFFRLLPT
jgi:hypothetical protein